MARDTSGKRGEVRSSALWGSGNRGGEHRSNALWGKGGRGLLTMVAVVAMAIPFAATATAGGGGKDERRDEGAKAGESYTSPKLLDKAKHQPEAKIRVIIRYNGTDVAAAKADGDRDYGSDKAEKLTKAFGKLQKKFDLIDGVALELSAKQLNKLRLIPGLIITEDAPVGGNGSFSTKQLWPVETGVNKLWSNTETATIAIVDSGVDAGRADFGGRVKQINFVSEKRVNSSGDGRGHGTFVAGIAAGSAAGYAGSAPTSKIISLDVMDDAGMGYTSDVIAAAEWIYQNKDAENIRVANFSLHSGAINHFWLDPLNVAVQKLWFSGVVVVAAAGNYGKPDGPSNVPFAPGSSPFVITVGAADIGGTHKLHDDDRAPWSAYGRTPDGFWKPEICAPGRYMVGPIPPTSTLAALKATNLKAEGYIELSGTSFAAPIISGVAAHILTKFPHYTPDQVKGALMHRARPVPQAEKGSCGVGQLNAVQAASKAKAPNPNNALNTFLKADANGNKVFDAVSWTDMVLSNVSWDAVSWSDVSWSDVSWDAVSWSDVSWSDVSWSDVLVADVSWEDAADQDPLTGDGYVATPADEAAAEFDPDMQPLDENGKPLPPPAPPVVETVAPVTETTTIVATATDPVVPPAPVAPAPVAPLSGV
jgi:serine protease AprX